MSPRPTTPPASPPRPAGPSTPPPPAGPKRVELLRLYSVRELAELWSVTAAHIYNLIADGALAVTDIARRGSKAKSRISSAEADRYIADHTRRVKRAAL
jgi:hypothetical protein